MRCREQAPSGAELAAFRQHGQIEILRHLADVVLTGQHPVGMAVHHQPAVALGVAGGRVERERLLHEAIDQELVGGGVLKIVNNTVPLALQKPMISPPLATAMVCLWAAT